MVLTVRIQIITAGVITSLPQYATAKSAGMDLCAVLPMPVTLEPRKTKLIPTGIAIALPDGFEAQVRPRSGLAMKHSITVLNSPGTIDSDYRGEIKVLLINHGDQAFIVEHNMRIAQLVIAKYEPIVWQQVEQLDQTERSNSGFGSTGYYSKEQ